MENNPILIENETNKLYEIYKDVRAKTESAKNAYVDLTGKIENLNELYKQKKTELDTIISHISSERLAWATEKAEELRKIEDKKSELDNALKLKVELNTQQEEIRKSTELGIQARNEQRELELKNKNTFLEIESEHKKIELEKKEIKKLESELEKKKLDFKSDLIKLIKNYE